MSSKNKKLLAALGVAAVVVWCNKYCYGNRQHLCSAVALYLWADSRILLPGVWLSSAQYPFQLLAVSRPVDISPLLSELSATLTSSSDVKQKELLKQEIVEMGAFALSGEVVERQFYIKIWDTNTWSTRWLPYAGGAVIWTLPIMLPFS